MLDEYGSSQLCMYLYGSWVDIHPNGKPMMLIKVFNMDTSEDCNNNFLIDTKRMRKLCDFADAWHVMCLAQTKAFEHLNFDRSRTSEVSNAK